MDAASGCGVVALVLASWASAACGIWQLWTEARVGGALIAGACVGFAMHLKVVERRKLWLINHLVMLLFLAFVVAVIRPVFLSAWYANISTKCLSRTKDLATALVIYTSDYDDRLPGRPGWVDALGDRFGRTWPQHCPAAETPFNYALNSAFAGKKLADIASEPERTVVIFECDSDTPSPSGGSERFSTKHHDGGLVGMLSGRAAPVHSVADSSLIWGH